MLNSLIIQNWILITVIANSATRNCENCILIQKKLRGIAEKMDKNKKLIIILKLYFKYILIVFDRSHLKFFSNSAISKLRTYFFYSKKVANEFFRIQKSCERVFSYSILNEKNCRNCKNSLIKKCLIKLN